MNKKPGQEYGKNQNSKYTMGPETERFTDFRNSCRNEMCCNQNLSLQRDASQGALAHEASLVKEVKEA